MKQGLAVVVAIFLLARGSGEAQTCSPLPFGVDPVNGNFTPTTWIEGDLSWVNNAMGAQFQGLWANTDFDMWFVGSAGVPDLPGPPIAAHFDGFTLQPFQIAGGGSLNGVWGSASNDVWAVGAAGLIVHWDGTQWVSVPSGTLETLGAVSGTASDDVFAAGPRVMLHWDGASWTPSPGFVPEQYDFPGTGLAAISRSDALVASWSGCQRWDGTSWHATGCGVQAGRAVFATGSNDVWVVGNTPTICHEATSYRAHWDGSSWSTTVAPGTCWKSIAGTGPTDIWIDATLHYDGTNWTEVSCGPRFDAMSVSNNGAIMGVNILGIEYFSGNDGWPFLARTFVPWIAIGGRDLANLWAVGGYGAVARYDGSRWTGQDFPLPSGSDAEQLGFAFGSSPSDIWGWAGGFGFRHFDGRSWTAVNSPSRYFAAGFARAPNDAIAVDRQGGKWHWDGSSWWEITLPIFDGDTINQLWGTAADDVWAVGCCSGGIHHWDGNAWQRVYTASDPTVGFVGGSARDDVWFTTQRQVAGDVKVLHFDGSSFTEVASFPGLELVYGITSTNPNDVWLQLYANLLHYDGFSWTAEPIHRVRNMLGVRGAGAFLTGYSGQIYQSH